MKLIIIDKKKNLERYQISFDKHINKKDMIVCENNDELLSKATDEPSIFTVAKPSYIDWVLDKATLTKFPNLVGIATQSSWKEYIDLKYCKEKRYSSS